MQQPTHVVEWACIGAQPPVPAPRLLATARGASTLLTYSQLYHASIAVSSKGVRLPMPTFGEKLRFLRQRAGLTQRQLAARLGYTDHSYIALVEQNKRNPTVELVLKVSDMFQVSADQLIRDALTLDVDDPTHSDDTT